MKTSFRNQLKGTVKEITKGQAVCVVKVDLGDGKKLSSIITVDALKDLDIKEGDEVLLLIKATAVALAK